VKSPHGKKLSLVEHLEVTVAVPMKNLRHTMVFALTLILHLKLHFFVLDCQSKNEFAFLKMRTIHKYIFFSKPALKGERHD